MVEKHSDQIKTLELQARQAAKKEEVVEFKKTMDDRLKRIERGEVVTAGGKGGNGGGGRGDVAQGKSRMLARIGKKPGVTTYLPTVLQKVYNL